jgi:hypothetical protein
MNYPVVLHKDPDSGYGVTVPDLPGCFSAGKTVKALDVLLTLRVRTCVTRSVTSTMREPSR